MVDQCLHFLLVTKRQEWDESHESLENVHIGPNERTVDPVQEDHQLVFVSAQFGECLQNSNIRI